MNPRTEAYLRGRGVPEDVIEALKVGRHVQIDADTLTSWLKAAFESGLCLRRAAVMAQIDRLDRYYDERLNKAAAENDALTARVRRLAPIETRWREHQAIVADVQQWFNGFAAAHAGRESWEQPRIPDPERLRDLNLALQSVDPTPAPDTEIPF